MSDRTHSSVLEGVFFILVLSVLLFLLKPLLLDGTHVYPHDGAYFYFPTFHFYADNLLHGKFPLWNPYSNGGQPFFPQAYILKMIDPVFIGLIYFYGLFTNDLVILFNWIYFSLTFITLLGSYLFLRTYSKVLWIRLSLIAILAFSSPLVVSLRQFAFQNQFLWVPWFLYFLREIIQKRKNTFSNWILLGLFWGWSLQGYYFGGISLFVLLAGLASLFFKRVNPKTLMQTFGFQKPLVASLIVLFLSLPSFAVLAASKDWTFTLRLLPEGYERLEQQKGAYLKEGGSTKYVNPGFFDYEAVRFTSSSFNFWDFAQWAYPTGNKHYHGSIGTWGEPSEAYFYLGILPLLIGFMGMFWGRGIHRGFWLFLLVAYGVIGLGPENPLYPTLFYSIPILWIVRHTNQFLLFFIFIFLLFYVSGANYLDAQLKNRKREISPAWLGLLTLPLLPGLIWGTKPLTYSLLAFVSFFPLALIYLRGKNLIFHRLAFISLLAGVLLIDYSIVWNRVSRLVRSQRSPATDLNIQHMAEAPKYFNFRKTVPVYPIINYVEQPGDPFPEQIPRYLPLLYRKPFALNALYGHSETEKSFKDALQMERWNELFMPTRYYHFLRSNVSAELKAKQLGLGIPSIEMDGEYSIGAYDHQSLSLTILNKGKGLLWRDGFDPYWEVTVDGKLTKLQPAFGIYKMLEVPKGSHQIHFVYRPRLFVISLWLYYLTSVVGFFSAIILILKSVIQGERKVLV